MKAIARLQWLQWKRRRGGATLNKSRRIYGDDNDTRFRLIAIGNAKVWVRFAQPFSSKWVMQKHTNG